MPDIDSSATPTPGARPLEVIVGPAAPDCTLPLNGAPGELIERLTWVIDQDDPILVRRWWAEIGMIVAVSIGGRAAEILPSVRCERLVVDDPRSSGVVRVGRSAYVDAIRCRLFDLVDDGLDERFLVRSLRDEIAHFLATDYLPVVLPAGDVDQLIARVTTDGSVRARLREESPYFAGRSDAEIILVLTQADRRARSAPDQAAVDALAQWAAQDAWAIGADAAISDEHFEQWQHRGRQVGRPAPRLRVVPPTEASSRGAHERL